MKRRYARCAKRHLKQVPAQSNLVRRLFEQRDKSLSTSDVEFLDAMVENAKLAIRHAAAEDAGATFTETDADERQARGLPVLEAAL